jgi:hypothetical protein
VRPVRVEVVDAAGRPVEGARVTPALYGSLRRQESWTDSEGNARFVVNATDAGNYAKETFDALVTLPAKSYKVEPVPWADEGETVAKVEVERGVLLRVKVFDEGGEPARGGFTLRWKVKRAEGPANDDESARLRLDAAFTGGGPPSLDRMSPSALATRRFDGPETVVTGFASGSTYSLELLEEGRCAEVQEIHFESGPILREVVFTRGPLAPVVLIPLVDDRMSPVVEGSFRLEVSYPDDLKPTQAMAWGENPASVVKPDRDGVIRVDIAARRRATLVLRHHAAGGLPWLRDEKKVLLDTEQSPLAPGDLRRLDPVTIPDQDVLVAGRVVDAGGRPVGGAVVRVAPGRTGGRMQNGEMELAQKVARTADDGTFTIRRPLGDLGDDREYRVFARLGDGAGSDLVSFDPGQRDVSVRVIPTGGLEGRLIAPSELGKLRVHVARTGFAVQEFIRRVLPDLGISRQAEEDGSFKFEHASAGRYDVIVSLGRHRVLKVEGVEVVSNRVVRDPRLDGVEVGGQLCRAVVVVTAPDGTPVPRARVSWSLLEGGNARGGRGHTSAHTGSDGQATTILPDTDPRLLRIAAAGFLPFEATNPIYPFDAVLDPGCALTVVVATEGPLPIEEQVTGWRVSLVDPGAKATEEVTSFSGGFLEVSASHSEPIVFSTLGGMGRTGSLSAVLNKKTGRGTIKAVAPGSYEVQLSPLLRRRGLKVAEGFLELPTPAAAAGGGRKTPAPLVIGRLTVRPGDREKTLHFSVAPAAIATMMQ